MTANGNTVNIKNGDRAYHHGDLRAALIRTGLELLETHTAEGISLREAARRVGVSPTAVYRHFPNKQSLLYALCEQAGESLHAAQEAAMAAAGGGAAGFAATGRAYVRFALANPALFRLLMTTKPPTALLDPAQAHAFGAMRLLRDNVDALLPEDATEERRRAFVTLAWSTVHGMTMLMLDGLIPADEALIDLIGAAEGSHPTGSAPPCRPGSGEPPRGA